MEALKAYPATPTAVGDPMDPATDTGLPGFGYTMGELGFEYVNATIAPGEASQFAIG